MVVLMRLIGFFVGTVKRTIFALEVKIDVNHKSKMEDILNLYRKK